MARDRPVFVCQACGYESARWMGRCPACGEWNALVEAVPTAARGAAPAAEATPIGAVAADGARRLPSGLDELDRVLGGGFVPGALVLLGGDPGVGKSTLLLQVAGLLGREGTALYVTGEESPEQLRLRAERLGAVAPGLLVAAETDVVRVEELVARHEPALLVVDSVQTMQSPDCPLAPGSPVQVREVAARLVALARRRRLPVVLVGHVTKEGVLAGPRLLEHTVDVVLLFEGDRLGPYRLLRGLKNRFGSTQELGIFEMDGAGLRQVEAPSRALLAERAPGVSGAVVGASMEGSRPLLWEVQALLAGPAFGTPRRTSAGIDAARLALILAVLERRCGLRVGALDAYLKVAGGLRLEDPASDLACALALASAYLDVPFPPDVVAVGEIGLGGEVRGAPRLGERLEEAARLGFRRGIVPGGRPVAAPNGMEVLPVRTLREAVAATLGAATRPPFGEPDAGP